MPRWLERLIIFSHRIALYHPTSFRHNIQSTITQSHEPSYRLEPTCISMKYFILYLIIKCWYSYCFALTIFCTVSCISYSYKAIRLIIKVHLFIKATKWSILERTCKIVVSSNRIKTRVGLEVLNYIKQCLFHIELYLELKIHKPSPIVCEIMWSLLLTIYWSTLSILRGTRYYIRIWTFILGCMTIVWRQ